MVKVNFKNTLYERIERYINRNYYFKFYTSICNVNNDTRKMGMKFEFHIYGTGTNKIVDKIFAIGGSIGGGRKLGEIMLKEYNVELPIKTLGFNYEGKPTYVTKYSPHDAHLYYLEGMIFSRDRNNILKVCTDKNKNIIGGNNG